MRKCPPRTWDDAPRRDFVRRMAVKLLRCSGQWVKVSGHPCRREALIDMEIEYETVAGAALPWQRDKRSELIEKTGGNRLPGDRVR